MTAAPGDGRAACHTSTLARSACRGYPGPPSRPSPARVVQRVGTRAGEIGLTIIECPDTDGTGPAPQHLLAAIRQAAEKRQHLWAGRCCVDRVDQGVADDQRRFE